MRSLAISGVDGSGKSTVVSLLQRYLKSRGLRVRVVWFRWRALTLYALYLYSRVRGLYAMVYVPRLRRFVGIHVLHLDPVARALYPYLLLVDLVIYHLIDKLWQLVSGVHVVVYDRFFLDALIDTIYTCRRVNRFFLALFLAMHRRASRSVVLDVDIDVALERKRDIISRRELEFKKRLYRLIAKYLGVAIVDTSNTTPQETAKNVLELLKPV